MDNKREIKFRAWDDNFKTMRVDISMSVDYSYNGVVPRNGITLIQYTGLKDKNGVEIYEGDVLQATDEVIVVAFPSYVNYVHPQSMEIIGNIYENPELLNGDV